MATKLSIYNGALTVLGERKIASLTEDREPRHKLDDVWGNDFIDRMLHQGQWNFAARSAELQASVSITPSFGFQFAFDKPTDFVRTMGVWQDEFMTAPLTHYQDESQWLFAELETIYIKYVSNDSQFGQDLSLWPPNFTEMAEHYMAMKVAPRLTGLTISDDELEKKWKRWLAEAKATDAMESPVGVKPQGAWARSRQGFRSDDRGRRNQLIG